MKFLPLFMLFFTTYLGAQVQKTKQNIRGEIVDKFSKTPIKGALVELLNFHPKRTAITDHEGKFILENIPYGRHKLLIEKGGYEDLLIGGLEVTAARELVLILKLEEQIEEKRQAIVTRYFRKPKKKKRILVQSKDQSDNVFAIASVRSFQVKEVNHFAANREDPARIMSNYVGISTLDDYDNSLVIRGNAPIGMQWRLEGLPISNPNHLGSFYNSGGASNMINLYALDNSDVFLGHLPSSYGNSFAGVFDAKLREGNKRHFNFMAQFNSMTGVIASVEGPLKKNENSSFIINYHHGLNQVLNYLTDKAFNRNQHAIPPRIIPQRQDLSFKIKLPSSSLSKWSIFGMAAYNTYNFDGRDSALAASVVRINLNDVETYRGINALLGLKHETKLGKKHKTSLETTLGGHSFLIDEQILNYGTYTDSIMPFYTAKNRIYKGYLRSQIQSKLSSKLFLSGGIHAEYTHTDIEESFVPETIFETFNYFHGSSTLLQAHSALIYRPSNTFQINFGLHGSSFLLQDKFHSYTVEPRFALQWQMHKKHLLYASFSTKSQQLPVQLYFTSSSSNTPEEQPTSAPNTNLRPLLGHQVSLGYKFAFSENWRLHIELFEQEFYNVPVDSSSGLNFFNFGSRFDKFYTLNSSNLINDAYISHIGAEVTLEKFFSKNYYGLLSLSFFKTGNGKIYDEIEWQAPTFGSEMNGKFVIGKEFLLKKRSSKSVKMSIDFKTTYAHRRNTLAIDTIGSLQYQTSIYDYEKGFTEPLADYFRVDAKVGFLFNNHKRRAFTHRLYFDFINVFDWKNVSNLYYDRSTNSIRKNYQMPFYLNIIYRIKF